MNPLLTASITGFLTMTLGLGLELFKVQGFHYGSGYSHLQFLGSYFYALHSPSAVMGSVTVLNFLIGAIPGLCLAALWNDIQSKRQQ
ncbi:hypothetical protein [Verrucomicrobium sp. BvORR106]|uniref:hypothetical protein n=1 Tax=Verrucomicrobium sp. BvORR106 TaxID=1403819 RepID=UPI0005700BA9|nr:hypothetical protein [Verrucomicrobium sp. BvORR106]